MEFATQTIETTRYSAAKAAEARHVVRLRRLILMGLATAMALATLAPMVVLAAG